MSDVELLTNLCAAEFHVQPDVASVKTIRHLQMEIVQPLTVYLKPADQAKQLISSARQLCHSANPVVWENIFVNPNLTKTEAEAAYHTRVTQRQQQSLSIMHVTLKKYNRRFESNGSYGRFHKIRVTWFNKLLFVKNSKILD
jgi:hypothetical protein